MKKMILLLALPLWMLPAYAQQKKKTVKRKKAHTAVKAKTAPRPLVVQEIIDVSPVAGPVEAPPPQETGIYAYVQQMPEFPGGRAAMMKFIADRIQYPSNAVENGVEGRVVIKFVVRASGKVTDAVIARDIGSGCGKEALRVINSMPFWKPGKQDGKPVDVYFNLPVTFKLDDPDPVPANTIK